MNYKIGFYILLVGIILTVGYGIAATAHGTKTTDSPKTIGEPAESGEGEGHHCPMMEYLEGKYPEEDFDELHERMLSESGCPMMGARNGNYSGVDFTQMHVRMHGGEEGHHCPMMEYLEGKYPEEDFDELHERFHEDGGDGDSHERMHRMHHGGGSSGSMMGMM